MGEPEKDRFSRAELDRMRDDELVRIGTRLDDVDLVRYAELATVHLALVWYQKHPVPRSGPHRGQRRRRPHPARLPGESGAFFIAVLAVLGLMGGLFQINPVWLFGPYDPAHISAGSQPDWYIGWLDGSTRLWPAWEFVLGRYLVAHGGPADAHARRGHALPVDRAQALR